MSAFSAIEFDGLEIETVYRDLNNRLIDALLQGSRVSLSAWRSIGSRGNGVYALYDADNQLVYLGKGDLWSRIRHHQEKIGASCLALESFSFTWVECSMAVAVSVEQQAIETLRPAWNGMGFGNNDQGRERNSINGWQREYGRADEIILGILSEMG